MLKSQDVSGQLRTLNEQLIAVQSEKNRLSNDLTTSQLKEQQLRDELAHAEQVISTLQFKHHLFSIPIVSDTSFIYVYIVNFSYRELELQKMKVIKWEKHQSAEKYLCRQPHLQQLHPHQRKR